MMNFLDMEDHYLVRIHMIKMMKKLMLFMRQLINEWMKSVKSTEKKDSEKN